MRVSTKHEGGREEGREGGREGGRESTGKSCLSLIKHRKSLARDFQQGIFLTFSALP